MSNGSEHIPERQPPYTPTTDEVRNNMALGITMAVASPQTVGDIDWPIPGLRAQAKAQFDRWLEARDREVRLAALEEAADLAQDFLYERRRTDYGDSQSEGLSVKLADGIRALRSSSPEGSI